ncbi:MAG: branched-chain-amino-acid transaminase, partial [Candidatus Bathyarchaeia archaeon]
ETLKKNGLRDAYIRLVVTRGVGDLGLDPRKCEKPSIVIIAEPMIILHGGELKKKGVRAIISWVRRDPVDATSHEIKTLNYMNSILAKLEANNAGVDEAICLDLKGHVSEGAAENIFIVKEGKIYTPPISTGALAGITRRVIIDLAKRLGYEVYEKDITPAELFNADEVFFTGTAAEVVPVREINGRVIGEGEGGQVTLRLQSEFMELVKSGREGTPIE